jgi:hypothetical protein
MSAHWPVNGHPELIDARQHPFLGYIRVDRQPVLGIGGEKKLSLSQTQQVVRARISRRMPL